MDKIILYTSHCPNCMMLQSIMDGKQIEYEIVDDEEIYTPIANEHDIMSMPFGEINGEVVTTKDLQKYVLGYEKKEDTCESCKF